MPLVLYYLQNT